MAIRRTTDRSEDAADSVLEFGRAAVSAASDLAQLANAAGVGGGVMARLPGIICLFPVGCCLDEYHRWWRLGSSVPLLVYFVIDCGRPVRLPAALALTRMRLELLMRARNITWAESLGHLTQTGPCLRMH